MRRGNVTKTLQPPLYREPEFPIAFREWLARRTDIEKLILHFARLRYTRHQTALALQLSVSRLDQLIRALREDFREEFF
jgi:phage head maturation protease